MTESIHPLSPVRRLAKSYSNQVVDGRHMVDLIDAANGQIVARYVYERYADEIIWAVNSTLRNEGFPESNWLEHFSHHEPNLEAQVDLNAAFGPDRRWRWRKRVSGDQKPNEWQYGSDLPEEGDSHE